MSYGDEVYLTVSERKGGADIPVPEEEYSEGGRVRRNAEDVQRDRDAGPKWRQQWEQGAPHEVPGLVRSLTIYHRRHGEAPPWEITSSSWCRKARSGSRLPCGTASSWSNSWRC